MDTLMIVNDVVFHAFRSLQQSNPNDVVKIPFPIVEGIVKIILHHEPKFITKYELNLCKITQIQIRSLIHTK